MNLIARFWNGPYPRMLFLTLVSLGAAAITAGAVVAVGQATYSGHATIAWATHVSETFFTGLLVTVVTGVILHWHANRRGFCSTVTPKRRCPFLGIMLLGLVLGGVSTALVWLFQHGADPTYETLIRTKAIQGVGLGLAIPVLFDVLGLLRHPDVEPGITTPAKFEAVTGEMGAVTAYVRNLILGGIVANIVLFPGLAWLFYHGKTTIDGAVLGSEIFFGGLICTLLTGTTGHFETAGKHGCLTCTRRGGCPFLMILLMGVGLGIFCALVGHLVLGNADVSFKTLMIVKAVQGTFLAVAIPIALVSSKLLLHPQVAHRL